MRGYEQLFYFCGMRQIRLVFEFYINSSIHVSFAVVALAFVTCHTLNISISNHLIAFLFFSTVTGYNFVKYAEVAGLHHRSLARSLRNIQIFSMLCGLGVVVTAVQLRREVIACAMLLGLLTFLYAIPFLSKKRNLRNIAGIKIYVIALVWSGVTVLLPVLENGLYPYWDVWIEFIQRFLFVIALMIPFEIRDTNFDDGSLMTLPQVVGIKKAKIIGVIWLFVFLVIGFFKDDLRINSILGTTLIAVVLFFLILKSKESKLDLDYYASFWVEAVPLVWVGLLLFCNYLDAFICS